MGSRCRDAVPRRPSTSKNNEALVRSRSGVADREHFTAQVSVKRGAPSGIHREEGCTEGKANLSSTLCHYRFKREERNMDFNLENLIEQANQCRHIETTAEHIVEMLATPNIDLVVALWPDTQSLGGTAVWLIKGGDLIELLQERQKRRKMFRGLVALWLRGEAHADDLDDEIERLVIDNTEARGEFAPIGGDFEFEGVPTYDNPDAIYVVKAGVRIARRGCPGTRERKRWIPLIPSYRVRDITSDQIEVGHGKDMLTLAALQ
jgi:hypothetical protein